MTMRVLSRLSFLALLAFGSSCTVQDTTMPQLAGPSELALRVALQAIPDSILQDGVSQAAIQIEATSFDGRAARGLGLRIQTLIDGVPQDFGTLSTKTVTTGDDGRARVTYTAPPRPTQSGGDGIVVTFAVEPIGSDYRGEVARTVDLRLVTPGLIQPPNPGAPIVNFTFTPEAPAILTTVVFDGSSTTDDGVPCPSCSYTWDFGDGESATGIFANHQFRRVGTYQVKLTVTDSRGASTTFARALQVGQGTGPTAAFTFSPASPAIRQNISFTAEASRATAGRHIVSYDWNFGSGRLANGVIVSHLYEAAGTYQVTLTVTDDAGNQGTVTQSVNVGGTGGLQAVLRVSPSTGGTPGTIFYFDGAESIRGASPIVEYRFNFGDGTPDVIRTSVTQEPHQFPAGTYQVSLQVKDSAGRTSIARISITVTAPTP
jgi:PKD repeat protein